MSIKDLWQILKQTFKDFADLKITRMSAALAYYTIFSLPGLIIIIVWMSEIFYGQQAVEGKSPGSGRE